MVLEGDRLLAHQHSQPALFVVETLLFIKVLQYVYVSFLGGSPELEDVGPDLENGDLGFNLNLNF